MTKKPKVELVLATWPQASTASGYFGSRDYNLSGMSCASHWLSLRAYCAGPDHYFTEEQGHLNKLGIYCWLDVDGVVSLDLRLQGVGSPTLRNAQGMVSTLKRYQSRANKGYPMLDRFVRSADPIEEVLQLLTALGVTKAVQYRPGQFGDACVPLHGVVSTMKEMFDATLAGMNPREKQEA